MADRLTCSMLDKGASLAFVRPKEGALVGRVMLDVKGSKNIKKAREYIDAVLDTYSQPGQAYGPANSLFAASADGLSQHLLHGIARGTAISSMGRPTTPNRKKR